MLEIKLATNETIGLAEFGHGHLVFDCADIAAFRAIEEKLRAEGALSSVTVTENDAAIAAIDGMTIAGTQTVENQDGTVTGHVYLRGGIYDLDAGEYAQAGRIMLGEEE